jgi:hypothetical protein
MHTANALDASQKTVARAPDSDNQNLVADRCSGVGAKVAQSGTEKGAKAFFLSPCNQRSASSMSIPDPENFIAVVTRFEKPLVQALDDYRRTLPELRPRSEIVRMLVARGLGVEPEPRMVSGHPLRSQRPDAWSRRSDTA